MFTLKKMFDNLYEDDKFKDILAYILDSDVKTIANMFHIFAFWLTQNAVNADWSTQTAFSRAIVICEKI